MSLWAKNREDELKHRILILQDALDQATLKSQMYSFLLLLSLICLALLLIARIG